jgi:hypothetical protein
MMMKNNATITFSQLPIGIKILHILLVYVFPLFILLVFLLAPSITVKIAQNQTNEILYIQINFIRMFCIFIIISSVVSGLFLKIPHRYSIILSILFIISYLFFIILSIPNWKFEEYFIGAQFLVVGIGFLLYLFLSKEVRKLYFDK